MKRLLHTLPLTAGCLFLSLVLLLLIQDVRTAALPENTSFEISRQRDSYEENGFFGGIGNIVNDFVVVYNDSGFFDQTVPFIEIKRASAEEIKWAYVQLFVLFSALFIIPVIIWERILQVYIISAGLFGLALIGGVTPGYQTVMGMAVGLVYLNLAKQYMNLKGKQNLKAFLRRFPSGIVLVYLGMLLLFVLLPYVLPLHLLPDADADTRDKIFNKLQQIRLVSDQYEERKQNEEQEKEDADSQSRENQDTEETDSERIQADESGAEEDDGDELAEGDDGDELTEDDYGDELTADGQPLGSDELPDGEGSLLDLFLSGSGGSEGPGFSFTSGGGVSGGRTDQTGNLDFSGKAVMEAYADFKPETDIYIRLFQAEKYTDNRWKTINREDPVFYSLDFIDLDGRKSYATASEMRILSEMTAGRIQVKSKGMFSGTERLVCSTADTMKDSVIAEASWEVPKEIHDMLRSEFSGVFDQDFNEVSEKEIAAEIGQLLDETAYYTLSPGKAPKDKDFVTWFLTDNKRGYCMHFASAGVMMLREAGLISRYAEGCFVSASDWEQREDGSWYAQIKDSAAHAWAEIYREEMGAWVPLELTPAYQGELADSFAGQPDVYIGRFVVPGFLIRAVQAILGAAGIVLLGFFIRFLYRKGKEWREYRLLHTGDNREDAENMMYLILRQTGRKNKNIWKLLERKNLTQEEFKKQISEQISASGQDEETVYCFKVFSNHVYKAAFCSAISDTEIREIRFLYRKLKCKLKA
ncbi:MAG: transglutaminase domain-containing protein [Lachnospiraceae bacterium]|nr:transglutaminase domain-containing protein [Lachnospiraceae bacterium]